MILVQNAASSWPSPFHWVTRPFHFLRRSRGRSLKLYEFVLEIDEGVSSYEQKEFVLASDDRAAVLFAQEIARRWRPHALYDPELEVYSTPDGVSVWMVARCVPITHLTVPVAGKAEKVRVALVPEIEVKT